VSAIRDAGGATIVVDENVAKFMRLANCYYVFEMGRIVFREDSDMLTKVLIYFGGTPVSSRF
jgi:ABC-type branched-subunit amino acid transport system ATPase component